jgi:hypothetical protein
MNTVHIKRWNGTFDRPGVIAAIRREIDHGQAGGTVMIDFDGTVITAAQVSSIICGYPLHKVIFTGHPKAPPRPSPENIPSGDAAGPRPSEESIPGDTEADGHGH